VPSQKKLPMVPKTFPEYAGPDEVLDDSDYLRMLGSIRSEQLKDVSEQLKPDEVLGGDVDTSRYHLR
jgi:hypothetical protein